MTNITMIDPDNKKLSLIPFPGNYEQYMDYARNEDVGLDMKNTNIKLTINKKDQGNFISVKSYKWLPLVLDVNQHFFVDRNILINLEKDEDPFLSVFLAKSKSIRIELALIEGQYRRNIDINEMRQEFARWNDIFHRRNIGHKLSGVDFSLWGDLLGQTSGFQRASLFLVEIQKFLFYIPDPLARIESIQKILNIAKRHGYRPDEIVVMLALSTLYIQNFKSQSLSTGVLKPKYLTSEDNAYNALSDIRTFIILSISNIHFPEYSYLTSDIGLVSLLLSRIHLSENSAQVKLKAFFPEITEIELRFLLENDYVFHPKKDAV